MPQLKKHTLPWILLKKINFIYNGFILILKYRTIVVKGNI